MKIPTHKGEQPCTELSVMENTELLNDSSPFTTTLLTEELSSLSHTHTHARARTHTHTHLKLENK